MKTKLSRGLLLCVLALLLSAGSGQALSITLALVVTTPEPIAVGETVDVDVEIAGLDGAALPSLSAYDLTVTFDASILAFDSIVFSSVLTPGFTGGPTVGVGTVHFFQGTTQTDLSSQPDSFTLATLTFEALAEGDANLGFTGLGIASLAAQSGGGSLFPDLDSATGDTVTVTVPEPGLLGLLALGLAAGTGQLRRRR